MIESNGHRLVKHDGTPVNVGDVIPDFRGEDTVIEGGKFYGGVSTGRVYTDRGEFYPSVCNLRWEKVN